jgi:hypothetical protein
LLALAGGAAATTAGAATVVRRYTVDDLRRLQPILARHEGVWEGVYRRYDAVGKPIGEHRSRVVIRFRPDPAGGSEIYEQTNLYYHPDGRIEEIQTRGEFDGERLNFYSDRVDGWSKDDTTDPGRRTCILYMLFKNQALDEEGYKSVQLTLPAMPRVIVSGEKFKDLYYREHFLELIGNSLDMLENVTSEKKIPAVRRESWVYETPAPTRRSTAPGVRPQHLFFDENNA